MLLQQTQGITYEDKIVGQGLQNTVVELLNVDLAREQAETELIEVYLMVILEVNYDEETTTAQYALHPLGVTVHEMNTEVETGAQIATMVADEAGRGLHTVGVDGTEAEVQDKTWMMMPVFLYLEEIPEMFRRCN